MICTQFFFKHKLLLWSTKFNFPAEFIYVDKCRFCQQKWFLVNMEFIFKEFISVGQNTFLSKKKNNSV